MCLRQLAEAQSHAQDLEAINADLEGHARDLAEQLAAAGAERERRAAEASAARAEQRAVMQVPF